MGGVGLSTTLHARLTPEQHIFIVGMRSEPFRGTRVTFQAIGVGITMAQFNGEMQTLSIVLVYVVQPFSFFAWTVAKKP